MGCDIHMRLERKVKGKWQYYPYWDEKEYWLVHIPRDYDLFGVLANVRSPHDDCISNPRGWPDDIDIRTKEDDYDEDDNIKFEELCDHSHSWLLLSEVLDFFNVSNFKWKKKTKQQERRKKVIEPIDMEWLYKIVRENIDPDTRNIRLIFGFDS